MPADRESPAVEWMARMRTAFQNAITEDDMREIAKGIAERAKKGDREALRLLLTHAMPQPVQPTEHRRLTVQAQAKGRQGALPSGAGRVIDADDE